MTFKSASDFSVLMFLLVVLAVILAETAGVYFAYRKTRDRPALKALIFFVGMVAWLTVVSKVVSTNILAAYPMPALMIFFMVNNLIALIFAFSPVGKKLAHNLPLPALVAFQGFRLPLELILHEWANQEVIPNTMTWTGSNLDIISGAVALVAAPFARNKKVAWTANIVGFVLLANVARVAILSSPVPFGWDTQPPLQLAFFIPYAWILPVCVGGALAGHVVLTRALLKNPLRRN